jgi:hypothetical protein
VSHNEPIAWAVLLADRDRIYDVYAIEEEAKAIDEVVTGNHGIVPLYRSPTLTDEEREAIAACIADDEAATAHERADTLRALLERTQERP